MIRWSLAAMWLLVGMLAAPAVARERAGTFVNLGPQITASTLIGTTFAKDADGRAIVCTVMRGTPAKLVIIDVQTGEIRRMLPLAGAAGGWNAVTASDGSVYAGTDSNGHLYRWVPGTDAAIDLGQVPPKQSWVWDLAAGREGEVFLATYPGCRIVRYHPDEGFKEVSNGPAAEGEQYARSLAYDLATRKLYAGVGSHAHLVEIDPATGTQTNLLPPEYADQEFVYGLDVIGHHLFALLTPRNQSLVFDLRTGKLATVLPAMTGQQVLIRAPQDQRVYYTVNNQLHAYDLARPQEPPVALTRCANALAMTWTRDAGNPTLVVFTPRSILLYEPQTGNATTRSFTVPTEPVAIQSLALGPDGRIWMGGYLSGGNAAFDPATGKSQEYKGLSQSESIAVLGNHLYFGIYPHARFASYDVTRPWNSAKGTPRQLGQIEGQSRPFAGIGVAALNQVFFGTIPAYGTLGGGIAVYDVASDTLTFHHQVVPDHSVAALAYVKNRIVGGTTIWGGLGAQPTAKEAKLFGWDPATKTRVFETVPLPGVSAIPCLIEGPDGNAWGLAAGTLFVFDPAAGTVLWRHKLFAQDYGDSNVWRDGFLLRHPSGQMYGTSGGRLFRLDPETKAVEILRNKQAGLTMDRQGRLYFRDTVNLWQYTP